MSTATATKADRPPRQHLAGDVVQTYRPKPTGPVPSGRRWRPDGATWRRPTGRGSARPSSGRTRALSGSLRCWFRCVTSG